MHCNELMRQITNFYFICHMHLLHVYVCTYVYLLHVYVHMCISFACVCAHEYVRVHNNTLFIYLFNLRGRSSRTQSTSTDSYEGERGGGEGSFSLVYARVYKNSLCNVYQRECEGVDVAEGADVEEALYINALMRGGGGGRTILCCIYIRTCIHCMCIGQCVCVYVYMYQFTGEGSFIVYAQISVYVRVHVF